MRADRRAEVRALLRGHEDGLSASSIADAMAVDQSIVRNALRVMPDCYIDRWVKPRRGPWAAIWCAVPVPEHCPRPLDHA